MTTTADYINELTTQRNNLADNLVTMGVAADHTETFNTLVAKVLQISGIGEISDEDLLSLEQAVINKGGTVTKAGEVATVEEILNGIGTIKTIKPEIQESSVTLYCGSSYQFTVQEYITVVWSVSGNVDTNTSISEGGLLTVGENESSTALTVTATEADGSSDSISVVVDVSKIPFTMPAMTANTTIVDSKTYIASASEEFDSTRKAYMPFNGTSTVGINDCWHTGTAHPQWLQLQLPFKVILQKFTMKNRSTNIEAPKDFILQGSNNGTDWTDLGNYVFSETQASGVVKQFAVDYNYTDGFTYYRWYVTTTVNGAHTVIAKIIFDKAFREI